MRERPADATNPAPSTRTAQVCPRCRRRSEPSGDPGKLVERCAVDGHALVSAEAFAAGDGDPFLGATIAGRFVVLARLGAGSMGTVYRARQEAMGRDVAIKILRSDRAFDAQSKARFEREAHAMSLLASPHTVTVFDFGEVEAAVDNELDSGTTLYLAMEMLEGESLGQRLSRVGRLGPAEAARVARQALLSLAEAHDKGVIHRDLKPDNVFLAQGKGADGAEIVKVLDFGIAKVVNDGASALDALETQAGTVFGTPRYMSPEQAQGKPLDARSDLYSLGLLLYQMVVGRPPFTDDDAVVVMARHIKTAPPSPDEVAPEAAVPRAFSELILRSLSKSPSARPASAMNFVAELDVALAQVLSESGRGGASATGEGAALELDAANARRAGLGGRRRRIAWLLIGAAAAGLAAWAGAARLGPSPEPVLELRAGLGTFVGLRPTRLTAAGMEAPAPELPGSTQSQPVPSTTSPSATAPRGPRKPGGSKKSYTRFE